jgi:hypothetical protein
MKKMERLGEVKGIERLRLGEVNKKKERKKKRNMTMKLQPA